MKIEANWPMKGEGGRFANLRLLACEPLLRLLVINWAIGVAVAAMTLGGLLALNTGGLRTLVFNAEDPLLPLILLFCGLMFTLCSATMGAAVMSLSADDDRPHGHFQLRPAVAPVKVAKSRNS